jgi:hypothetical protein
LSKINITAIDDPTVSAQALTFETEVKWYPSALSAMLCQQGFLFDSLGQNDNSKMCFEAACRMLSVQSHASADVQEPFLKIILRNRIITSQTPSALATIPETFERIPVLRGAFDDHSATVDSSAKVDDIKYMNITGWMAFCAKYRFHVFFPTLTRSKCIGCFMETAKKSYGNTLLLSFTDFCSCLLLSRDAGIRKDLAAGNPTVSEAARVAAVVAFLKTLGFFDLKKHPVQKKHHKFFSTECCNLTTNVELPILRSILENQSETWSMNCSEIVVLKGDESDNIEAAVSQQSDSVTFRAPVHIMLPLEDVPSSSRISNALAFLTAQVSSLSFSCACLKLNRPVLTKQGCLYALHLMNIKSKNELISGRVVQIIAIAKIQQALCCSDATRTKAFFSKYHRQIRHASDDLESMMNESKIISSYHQVVGTSNNVFQEQRRGQSTQRIQCGPIVDRTIHTKPAKSNFSGIPDAATKLSQAIPDLPAEIIRF